MSLPPSDIRSPFKFLDPYERSDGGVFFGRQAEVEALYQAVKKNRIVLLYGSSGTGKTSLVQCGLANRFEVTDWVPFWIRRGVNINESLQLALSQSKAMGGKAVTRENVIAALQHISERYVRPVYLIFDQFEELLLLGEAAEKAAFLESLQMILADDRAAACHLLFIIREEYFGWLESFEIAIPGFSDRRLRVEPMRPAQLDEVILHSCQAFNITLEAPEKNTRQIRESLRSKGGIALPYLQVYLDLLYREDYIRTYPKGWQGTGYPPLTFETEEIAAMGAIEDIMERFLQDRRLAVQAAVSEQFPQAAEDTISRLLDAFVTEEGTKRPIGYRREGDRLYLREQAPPDLQKLPTEILAASMQLLEKSRLLRADEDTYELAHDSLAALIDQQRSTEQRRLNEIRSQIRNSYRIYQETKHDFLSRNQLAMYEAYLPILELEPHLKAFVDRSYEELRAVEESDRRKLAEERQLRKTAETERQRAIENAHRAKIRTRIALIAMLISLTSVYFFVRNQQARKQVREQAQLNEAVNLAVKARRVFYQDHNLAWHLSAQSFKIAEREETAQALRDMSYAVYPADTVWAAHPAGIVDLQFSEDGRQLLTAAIDGTIRISRPDGTALQNLWLGTDELYDRSIAFSPDARYAIVHNTDEIVLWDVRSGEPSHTLVTDDQVVVDHLTFSPGSRTVAIAMYRIDRDQTTIHLRSVDDLAIQDSLSVEGMLVDMAYTTDGRQLLLGRYDLPLLKHALNSNKREEFSYPAHLLQTRYLPASDQWLMANREYARLYRSGGQPTVLNGHNSEVIALAADPQQQLLLSLDISGNLLLWNQQGEILWNTKIGSLSMSGSISFSPDGSTFLAGTSSGHIYRWSVRPEYRESSGQPQPMDRRISVAPDGLRYVTAGLNGRVQLWDQQRERLAVFRDQPLDITQLRFSPDGAHLAIAGEGSESTIDIWQLPDRRLSRTTIDSRVRALDFVPDRQQVLFGTKSGMIRLMSYDGSNNVGWTLDSSAISTLAVAPDGRSFFAATDAGKAGIWSTDGQVQQEFALPQQAAITPPFSAARNTRVTQSIYSPDGRYLLTGDRAGMITLWKTDGTLVRRFDDHHRAIIGLAFSPDGRRFVSLDDNNLINVWQTAGLRTQAFQRYDQTATVQFTEDAQALLIGTYAGLRQIDLWEKALARRAVPLINLHREGVDLPAASLLASDNPAELVISARYFAERYLAEGGEEELRLSRRLYEKALSPALRTAYPLDWWQYQLQVPEAANLWPLPLQELYGELREKL